MAALAAASRSAAPAAAALAVALAVLAPAACRDAGPAREAPPEAAAPAVAPAPLAVEAGRGDLVFRYVDPEGGAVATATRVEDIPAAARREVVVFAPDAPAPPGWAHVADLSAGLPATTRPTFGFAFAPRLAAPAAAPAAARPSAPARAAARGPGGAHEVVLFTTPGCGFCRQARAWLKKRGVPYSEYDLASDPRAEERLAALARAAGVPRASLQGVPILFVDGRPMVGFDPARAAALLGG